MERPKLPAELAGALAENTGILKFYSELTPEKQRMVIDSAKNIGSHTELRAFLRRISGF